MTPRKTLLLIAAVVVASTATSLITAAPVPGASELRRAVLKYFEAKRDFRPGDLVTRETAEPLLGKLRKMGVPLRDSKQILGSMLSSTEFLPRQFETADGRRFMRQISGYPGAYDRLDRLSRLPHGEQTIRDLIRGPDGYTMVRYMTTTAGGQAMGNMVSNAPGAGDFNAPTGHIYTAEDLLGRLEASRAAAAKASPKRK